MVLAYFRLLGHVLPQDLTDARLPPLRGFVQSGKRTAESRPPAGRRRYKSDRLRTRPGNALETARGNAWETARGHGGAISVGGPRYVRRRSISASSPWIQAAA